MYKIQKLRTMAVVNRTRSTGRLEARLDLETKALLQKAADLEGRSLTDFVVASAQAEARRIIAQHQNLKLSIEDSEAFVDALLNPAKPNERLKTAALRYKQIMEG